METKKNKCAVDFLSEYLKFKGECITAQIFDLEEIIKLFEVYLKFI